MGHVNFAKINFDEQTVFIQSPIRLPVLPHKVRHWGETRGPVPASLPTPISPGRPPVSREGRVPNEVCDLADNVVELLLVLDLNKGGVALEAELVGGLPRVSVLAAPEKATQPKKWSG